MKHRMLAVGSTALLVGLTGVGHIPASSAAPSAHVNACWSTDNGEPVVDSVSFSTGNVDTTAGPASVTVTVHAHDTGGPGPATGIRHMGATFRADEADSGTPVTPELDVRLTRSGHHTWTGTLDVPRGANGRYDAYLRVRDAAGLFQAGAGLEPDVTDAVDAHGTPDTTRPVLTDLSVSPTAVDTRHHTASVHVSATVDDDRSGPLVATVESRQTGPVTLHRQGHTDVFRADLPVERWSGSGHWVFSVDIADRDWNHRTYSHHRLVALGFPAAVSVTSGPEDTTHPHVGRVTGLPEHVDLRHHGRWLTFDVHATDNHGITAGSAHLFGTAQPPVRTGRVALHRVSGTARAGTWRGRIHVGPCFTGPVHGRLRIQLRDAHGHRGAGDRGDVELVTLDRTPPATTHTRWRRHTVSTRFSEPVHGISSNHVDVLTAGGDAITGSWTCRSANGSETSCRHGAVRAATFSVDPGGHAPDSIDWEPDHLLKVLDRAGNPFDADTFDF